MLTLSQLSAEGIVLSWVPQARAGLLVLAVGWSGWLVAQTLVQLPTNTLCRTGALCMALIGVAAVVTLWFLQFYVW